MSEVQVDGPFIIGFALGLLGGLFAGLGITGWLILTISGICAIFSRGFFDRRDSGAIFFSSLFLVVIGVLIVWGGVIIDA